MGQNRTFRDIRPDYIFFECPNLFHSVPSHGANESPASTGTPADRVMPSPETLGASHVFIIP